MKKSVFLLRFSLHATFQRIASVRTGVLILLLFFLTKIYIEPIKDFAIAASYKSSIWILPFLLSNIYFQFVYLAGVIYYFSGVPFTNYSEMFNIIRFGRLRWGVIQVFNILVSSLFFVITVFIFSLISLFPQFQFEIGWGKVLHTLSLTDAGSQYGSLLSIPYELMNNYSALGATLKSMTFTFLVIFLLGILMYFISLSFSRIAAICTGSILIVLPVIVENYGHIYKWLPYISPVSWMRLTSIGMKDIFIKMPTETFVFSSLSVLGCLLIIGSLARVRSIEFDWMKDD